MSLRNGVDLFAPVQESSRLPAIKIPPRRSKPQRKELLEKFCRERGLEAGDTYPRNEAVFRLIQQKYPQFSWRLVDGKVVFTNYPVRPNGTPASLFELLSGEVKAIYPLPKHKAKTPASSWRQRRHSAYV